MGNPVGQEDHLLTFPFSQYFTCPKLKLVNPSQYRFEHLVTQMKWRLQERAVVRPSTRLGWRQWAAGGAG